ncbi:MAG: aspartate/glutamate racemase family protein [Candidatus Heimdallarchaeota archaeon]|nr:aspartate/glutamate racemase family protein [Candidatus Heimdallarchaeota archaeon]
MKKIGIIGGLSAESSVEYYKILIKEYNRRVGGAASPLLIIDSLNLGEVVELMKKDNWDEVFRIIHQSATNLEKAGAEVIIIATNTIHKVFDRVESEITTPMISILDVTAEAAKSLNLKKVGLLGTIFTMQSDFYHKAFQKHNIEIIVPNPEDQEFVNKVIFDELTYHILTPESKAGYIEIIWRLRDEGAEGVILGCTEIPLLIQQDDCPIPVFDTTTLHALAALEYALK